MPKFFSSIKDVNNKICKEKIVKIKDDTTIGSDFEIKHKILGDYLTRKRFVDVSSRGKNTHLRSEFVKNVCERSSV